MPVLLRLDSSADLAHSRTRLLTRAFVEAWHARGPGHTVLTRDLHTNPLPHMTQTAQHWPERLRGGETLDESRQSLQDEVIAELLSADVVVIGAPMYNYSMPSTLKAWIDLIHVPAITAPFDVQTQPMKGRTAILISARGAAYDAGTPQADWDHVTPPLALVLGEGLGMDVRIVTVDRTLADTVPALEPALAERSLAAALARTTALAAEV